MRSYERTHPWLTFGFDMNRLGHDIWLALGEIRSKCDHIAGTPLQPQVAEELHQIYLAKGAFATTAIEGNTLSEEEVRLHLQGRLHLPPSKEYLRQEVDNVVRAVNHIGAQVLGTGALTLTSQQIKEYNGLVLAGLQLEEGVVPGAIRTYSVGAGRYKGAPAEDRQYLLDRLCEWLNNPIFYPATEQRIVYSVLRAILAHIYIAWIHPFGDGNGRTARLIEFQVLLAAGVPTPAGHLLSNHYNQTRPEYYRQLDYASKSGGDVVPFIRYAVTGFIEGLKEQLNQIREQQWHVAWQDFIYRSFDGRDNPVDDRRRDLALALSTQAAPVPLPKIPLLNPRVAQAYATKTEKTIVRDLAELISMQLVLRTPAGYVANRTRILSFLPPRREHQPTE